MKGVRGCRGAELREFGQENMAARAQSKKWASLDIFTSPWFRLRRNRPPSKGEFLDEFAYVGAHTQLRENDPTTPKQMTLTCRFEMKLHGIVTIQMVT